MLAQKPGDASVLEWLIERHGLDVNPGQPALRYKTKEQARRQLTVHLDSSAGDEGNTPLHLACFHGRLEAMEVLLKHGANTDVCNLAGKVPRIPCPKPEPMRYLEPKDIRGKGHWRFRGRQWIEGKIDLPERDSKGRVKLSAEEIAERERLRQEKLKMLKRSNSMPKGQVQFPKESIDEVTES